MALDRKKEIQNAHTLSDKIAGYITNIAGSMPFLLINAALFTAWILVNIGVFGDGLIVDEFPFSFLTTALSIEAILLSTFVLMSQRRQSRITELRTELDYRSDLQSEVDVKAIVGILERLAKSQNVDVSDLVQQMKVEEVRVAQTD